MLSCRGVSTHSGEEDEKHGFGVGEKNYFHGKHPKTQFVQTQRHTLTMGEIIKAAKWTPSFVMLTLTTLKALKEAAEGVVCRQPLGL